MLHSFVGHGGLQGMLDDDAGGGGSSEAGGAGAGLGHVGGSSDDGESFGLRYDEDCDADRPLESPEAQFPDYMKPAAFYAKHVRPLLAKLRPKKGSDTHAVVPTATGSATPGSPAHLALEGALAAAR